MNAGYLVDWNKNRELYHIYKEQKMWVKQQTN